MTQDEELTLATKFRVVHTIEELHQQTDYQVLYITNDPNKVLALYLMRLEKIVIGRAWSSYNNCEFLTASTVVLLRGKDPLPEPYLDGYYYKEILYHKHRSSYAFPYTPSKGVTDEEVSNLIEQATKVLKQKGVKNITVTNKKELKPVWEDTVFNVVWVKSWIRELNDIETDLIRKQNEDLETEFQEYIEELFKDLPVTREKNYYSGGYQNRWRVNFTSPKVYMRFSTCKRAKLPDGSFAITCESPFFEDKIIKTNQKKNIKKIIEISMKFLEDIYKYLV